MPIFEYKCENCQYNFEELIFSSQKEEVRCPKCYSDNLKRLISIFGLGGEKGGNFGSTELTGSSSGCGGCSASTCNGCR